MSSLDTSLIIHLGLPTGLLLSKMGSLAEQTAIVAKQATDSLDGEPTMVDLPMRHLSTRLGDIAEDTEPELDNSTHCASSVANQEEANLDMSDHSATAFLIDSYVPHDEFCEAIKRGDVELVKSQLRLGAAIERMTDDGFHPLVIAIMAEQVDVARILLKAGANVHQRVRGLPALVHALMTPNRGPELMQLLLDHGANLNTISGSDQRNALHWATCESMAGAVDFLVAKGIDIESRCSKGRTPLILAAEAGYTHVAKVLWAQGADINATSENGGTPTIWAACKNNVETLKFLLEKGAKVDVRDNLGHSTKCLYPLIRIFC